MAPRIPIGTAMNGYLYRGGDPASEASWLPDRGGDLSLNERKELADIHTASANARRAAGQAREFMAVNEKVRTGGLYGIPGASELAGAWYSPISTLQGLSNRMLPNMHVTPGPMTDADAKMYRSAVPNPNNPRATNRALTKGIEAQDAEQRARAAFYDKWAQFRGTTRGADAEFAQFWGSYSADPDAWWSRNPDPNRERPSRSAAPAAPRRAAPATSGWSIERIQ